MNRLRRRASAFDTTPCAAEVLEYRSLLSAAGAVHGAIHHAAAHTSDVAPLAFHQTGTADVVVNASIIPMQGKISVSHVTLTQGAALTAHVNYALKNPGEKVTVKGTLKGIISNIQTASGTSTVTLSPNGGRLTFSARNPGVHAKGIAFPSNKILEATFLGETFFSIAATDIFAASAPPQLAGKTLSIETSP